MAHGTYEETHRRILESGKKMFLENGFERTNLRDLCREAGITTGSFYRHFESKEDIFSYFVQPAVDDMENIFSYAETYCAEVLETGDMRKMWMTVEADDLLDYIYRNFDALKLLLKCSDGTKYSDFLNDIVSRDAEISLRILRRALELGLIDAELPSEPEMHMLCHAYLSSVFEAVLHDLSREDMDRYIRRIVDLFTAGEFKALGI